MRVLFYLECDELSMNKKLLFLIGEDAMAVTESLISNASDKNQEGSYINARNCEPHAEYRTV